MAYLDHRTGRNQRAMVMGIVAVLQGGAIVALVNGLAVHFIKPPPPPNLPTHDVVVPLPTPIPPPPKRPVVEQQTRITNPAPKLPLPGVGPVVRDMTLPPLGPLPEPGPTQAIVPPSPTPSFTPRWARPRNSPASWATTSDYPTRDLREGNQGTTQFILTIDAEGRVEACAVTGSSGYPGLDKATCDNVSRRARFEPATDGGGNRVGGSYKGAIHWVIPQD
jgi:protein TonB